MKSFITTLAEKIASKQNDVADWLVKEHMPSGSGIDSGTKINWEKTRVSWSNKTNKNRIVLIADFHHMDEHGSYDGWTEHEIVITPNFGEPDIKVTGRNRNGIKEYLAETYQYQINRTDWEK